MCGWLTRVRFAALLRRAGVPQGVGRKPACRHVHVVRVQCTAQPRPDPCAGGAVHEDASGSGHAPLAKDVRRVQRELGEREQLIVDGRALAQPVARRIPWLGGGGILARLVQVGTRLASRRRLADPELDARLAVGAVHTRGG